MVFFCVLLGLTRAAASHPHCAPPHRFSPLAKNNNAQRRRQNIRKGDFSRPKVRGKRAIDLGSGMGLAGLALALVGADVVLTDVAEVLPLLRRNSEANLSPAALRGEPRGLGVGLSWREG